MPKYTFWRNAIVGEYYEVTAASQSEAEQKLYDGECDPVHTEWVDWATGGYELENVEDDLITFLHSKETA